MDLGYSGNEAGLVIDTLCERATKHLVAPNAIHDPDEKLIQSLRETAHERELQRRVEPRCWLPLVVVFPFLELALVDLFPLLLAKPRVLNDPHDGVDDYHHNHDEQESKAIRHDFATEDSGAPSLTSRHWSIMIDGHK